MAVSSYPANHPLAVKLWSRKLAYEALKQTYLSQFLGNTPDSLIQTRDETSKSAGDQITIGLRMLLSGGGIIGDGTLEGQEEALTTYSDALLINQLRHAVRSAGKMSEQRIPFEIREEARSGLQDWWADRFDIALFNQLCGFTPATDLRFSGNNAIMPYDADHIIRVGQTAADEELKPTDVFDLSVIDRCVETARTLTPMIRPIKIRGDSYYVMFLHPYQVYDLRRSSTAAGSWYDIQRMQLAGGKLADNPIFTGALGVYNNVIMHESFRVTSGVASTGAAVPTVKRAVFCGAQSAAIAFGRDNSPERATWVEELFDYGNQLGVSAGFVFGLKRLVFNNQSFSSLVVPTYATKH